MLAARYRTDYHGEFVIVETVFSDGIKKQKREWVPNAIENHHISDRAAVIGSSIDRYQFDYSRLQKHRGGLLGKKRLQTYGTNEIWEDLPLDFFISTNPKIIQAICDAQYEKKATVYSNAKLCLSNPGRLYLTPCCPALDDVALPLYLAAFDNHKEIYMLGYNQEMPIASTGTLGHVASIIRTYAGTKFILVGVRGNMPKIWLDLSNVSTLSYRDWISHCDV